MSTRRRPFPMHGARILTGMSLYTYNGEYHARYVGLRDADTLLVHLYLGKSLWRHDQPVRVLNINAPEESTPEGLAATAWVEAWAARHCTNGDLTVRTLRKSPTGDDKRDGFGRLLGIIVAPDGAVLADDLLTAGHAAPYMPRQAS